MSSKNSGLMTLNELFAMKKNIAYQAKFEHRLSSMKKDFYHKRENLKQAIKSTVHEMKDIQSSTGYSLDEDERSRQGGRVSRKSVVYFPPIGMKLMKKYVELDVQKLPRFFSTLPRLSNKNEAPAKASMIVNHLSGYNENDERNQITEAAARGQNLITSSDIPLHTEDIGDNINTLPKIVVTEPTADSAHNSNNSTSNMFQTEAEDDIEDELDDVFEDTVASNVSMSYRRSSRSTFRTRTSVRFLSQPSILEEHNLHVIAMSRTAKAKSKSTTVLETHKPADDDGATVHYEYNIGQNRETDNNLSSDSLTNIVKFCLDYGDGKLHDILKVPKIKDCSRPWCNPFCKTCQLRSTSRPCFVLIPYEGNEPPRKIAGKRRPSMFPVYNSNKVTSDVTSDSAGSFEKKDSDYESTKTNGKKNVNNKQNNSLQSITGEMDKDPDAEDVSESVFDDTSDEEIGQNEEKGDKSMKGFHESWQNVSRKRKGYSKRRMEELSQPRWGHPAEVRFSKASLRRKKEQLTETERSKVLSLHEQQNLAYIQGKISLFLAMLNQQEVIRKPKKMVDIPIREVIDSDKLIHEAKKRKKMKAKMVKLRRKHDFDFNT